MNKHVMFVCSGGGHNDEAVALLPAFSGCDITFVTYRIKSTQGFEILNLKRVLRVPLYSEKIGAKMVCSLFLDFVCFIRIISKLKPDLIVSTGSEIAIPAFIAAILVSHARRIHIETIARTKELSLSGKVLLHLAHKCYVQWPDLAARYSGKVFYAGRVF